MRSIRIELFKNDDLIYRFASREGPGGRVATPWPEIEEQLGGIDPDRPPKITISGSDPLEHDALPRLIDRLGEFGVRQFRLVTDGFGLAHDAVLRFLESRGVSEVFVVFPSVDPDTYSKAMRTRRRFEACRAGLENAARFGLEVHVVMPLTRWSAETAEETLAFFKELPLTGLLVELPLPERVPPGLDPILLPYPEAAELVARVFGANRRSRRTSGMFERATIPACGSDGKLGDYGDLFNQRNRHYRVRETDRLVRIPQCTECDIANACRGVDRTYLERFGAEGFRPIPLAEANAWYTKPINRLEEVPYKRFSPYDNKNETGTLGLLRINGHCNMGCSFCFVDLSEPDVAFESLKEEIDRLSDQGVTDLVVSGGEPTLHPALPRVIEYARGVGFDSIELQSNGVRLANKDFARSIAESGLDIACISLHSYKADESDEITKRPRAYGRTVQAIHNLRELGVWTRIAHVINRLNYQDMPEFVRFARQEWETGQVDICFAIAQEMSAQTSTWILPTFTEIKPYVREALDFCLENGMSFSGLIGNGGYPPCMLDGELKYYEQAFDQIHTSSGESFYKAERCRTCAFDHKCVGVRRAYIDTYGDDEIRPF